MKLIGYISQESKQATTRQDNLWTSTTRKQYSRLVKNLLHSFSSSPFKYFPPVKKVAYKNRIFHTCSKLIHSHSIVKSYSTYSHSIVIPYLKHSRQSVVRRSSDGGQIVVRQSGYTKLISYNSIPYGFLKHVPQQFPRAPT